MATLTERVQRLSLSGLEIGDMTGWSDAMVEDYLNIGESLQLIASFVDGIVTFPAVPTEDAGDGTVSGDMNATDWTGDEHAQGTALFIGENETCIVSHKDILYQYVGIQPVTIGVGGDYISTEADYVPLSSSDHQALNNRDSADCHPISAITGLQDKVNEYDTHVGDGRIHGRYYEQSGDPKDDGLVVVGSQWLVNTSTLRINTGSGWLDITMKSLFDALSTAYAEHVAGTNDRHTAEDIDYQDVTVPPFGATNVQGALEALDLLIKGRVRWLDIWVAGTTYYLNDMVLDGEWTMIATTTTTDRPAPQIQGTPDYYLPDSPSWTNALHSGVAYTGFRFTTVVPFVINGIRAWVPDINSDIRYTAYIIDESAPNAPVVIQAIDIDTIATAVGWVPISFGTTFISENTNITLMLVTRRFVASPEWTWQWTQRNSTTTPASGDWSSSSADDILYINQLDNLGTNRDTDIGSLVAGDEITISESAISSRFTIYRVLSVPTLSAGVWTIPVVVISTGGNVRNNRLCDIHAIPTTTTTDAPYVYLPNYLTVTPPDPSLVTNVTGFLDDQYPPVVTNDNGYGIDMSFSGVTVSPDWDIVSHGTGQGVASGTLWGQITGDVLDQTDMIQEMNKRAIAMALALGG